MTSKNQLSGLIIIFIIVAACKKSDIVPVMPSPPTPVDTTKPSSLIINCQVWLKGDTIVKVENYNATDTIFRMQYDFQNGTVEVHYMEIDNGYKNSWDEVYFLNSQGAAIGAVLPYGNGYVDSLNDFIYVNGYLVEAKGTRYGATTEPAVRKFIIDGKGNIVETAINIAGFVCADQYSFNKLPNAMDIHFFKNDFLGKRSTNLIDSAYYREGCPACGPSTIHEYSKFSYTLNNQNRVDRMTEFTIPCRHTGDKADTVYNDLIFKYIEL